MKKVYLFNCNTNVGTPAKPEYYLPYSIGLLWAYVSKFEVVNNNFQLEKIFFKLSTVEQILSQISDPSVVAFSNYIWNWEHHKAYAKAIKEKWPDCVIIFGGPQVTNRPFETQFLKKHPYVDIVSFGAGEDALLDVFKSIAEATPYKKIYGPSKVDLDDIPSPYLNGTFDTLIANNPEITWHALIETNRGCPYQCTFCDWGGVSYNKVSKFNLQRVFDELDYLGSIGVIYLYVADANFGMLYERDEQIVDKIIEVNNQTGSLGLVGLTWAKNLKPRALDAAKKLSDRGILRGLSLSVQSTTSHVLENIKRKNMGINDLESMFKLCQEKGISAYTELILPLPGETLVSWKMNYDHLLSMGLHGHVDAYFAQLLENTELYTLEQREKYAIEEVSFPFVFGNAERDDNINELQSVIRSTNTMTVAEVAEAYAFSYILTTYHRFGWTRYYSIYLYKVKRVRYYDFYSELEEYLQTSDTFLGTEYQQVHNSIIDQSIYRDFHAIPKRQSVMFLNRETVEQEIINFITRNYGSIIDYNDLLDLHLMQKYANIHNKESTQITLSSNLYDFLINDVSREYSTTTYEITPIVIDDTDWTTAEGLSRYLYNKRRQSSGLTKFTRLLENE